MSVMIPWPGITVNSLRCRFVDHPARLRPPYALRRRIRHGPVAPCCGRAPWPFLEGGLVERFGVDLVAVHLLDGLNGVADLIHRPAEGSVRPSTSRAAHRSSLAHPGHRCPRPGT